MPAAGAETGTGGKLHVRNCVIRNFNTAGIHIRAGGRKRVVVSDCMIADNKHDIWVRGGGGDVQAFLDRVTVEGNVGNGIRAQGSGARVRIDRSAVTNNGKGSCLENHRG